MPEGPPEPKVPENLNPMAREILDRLKGRPEAHAIVLGGGVALQHYLDATSNLTRRFQARGAPSRLKAFVTTLGQR